MAFIDINNENSEKIQKTFFLSLKKKDKNQLKKIFQQNPIMDIAEIASNYDEKQNLIFIFQSIDNDLCSEFFAKLDEKTQEFLVTILKDDEIKKIITSIYSDDLVNIIKNLPTNLQKKILKNYPKEKKENIKTLLNYKEDTAASLITTEYIELSENITAYEALKQIREIGQNVATIYTIFLKNNDGDITGLCELNKILFAENEETLTSIKDNIFVYVTAETDQEEVAKKMKKYNLNVIPVINEKKLIGIITIDDIIDIIEEETTEDIELQAGVIPLKDNFYDIPSLKMALNYSPWLIGLMITNIFTSMLLSRYEDKLTSFIFLTAFIPVILDTCGNAGGQTCSVIIRALAIDDTLISKKFLSFFIKEFKTSFLTAFFVSSISLFIFMLEIYFGLIRISNDINLFFVALIISGTLFFSLLIAKMLGFLIPILAKKLKKDPALMSEPIITTIADFVGILIYFGIASIFLKF
ncbi:MAG: magnesium transporter [Bacilli bacterium]|nr:magnesium transporter [Bacilli bacterium]